MLHKTKNILNEKISIKFTQDIDIIILPISLLLILHYIINLHKI